MKIKKKNVIIISIIFILSVSSVIYFVFKPSKNKEEVYFNPKTPEKFFKFDNKIKQGLKGYVVMLTGDCLPNSSGNSTCKLLPRKELSGYDKPVDIFIASKESLDGTGKSPTEYFNEKELKIVKSQKNVTSTFEIPLKQGQYYVLTRDYYFNNRKEIRCIDQNSSGPTNCLINIQKNKTKLYEIYLNYAIE
ncbi:MAG: hypothetical protein U0R17_02310 [Acidimicrobiia bacterium]